MTTPVHQLDDGAWISVNDSRVMNVSDLWLLIDHAFCDCEMADVLAEGFIECGVVGLSIEARFAGQCISCGAQGVTGWLQMGRLDPETGTFRPVEAGSVHRPRPDPDRAQAER